MLRLHDVIRVIFLREGISEDEKSAKHSIDFTKMILIIFFVFDPFLCKMHFPLLYGEKKIALVFGFSISMFLIRFSCCFFRKSLVAKARVLYRVGSL